MVFNTLQDQFLFAGVKSFIYPLTHGVYFSKFITDEKNLGGHFLMAIFTI